MKASRCAVGLVAVLIFISPLLGMQWPSFPTADAPKTVDGKPNLEGPTPRTPDGKPDLSGIWEFRGRGGGGRGVGGTFTVAGKPRLKHQRSDSTAAATCSARSARCASAGDILQYRCGLQRWIALHAMGRRTSQAARGDARDG